MLINQCGFCSVNNNNDDDDDDDDNDKHRLSLRYQDRLQRERAKIEMCHDKRIWNYRSVLVTPIVIGALEQSHFRNG